VKYRYTYITVVAAGMAFLVLASWLVGEYSPNLLVMLIGVLVVTMLTGQGMLVALLAMATRHDKMTDADQPR
jgi:hypothetical protein